MKNYHLLFKLPIVLFALCFSMTHYAQGSYHIYGDSEYQSGEKLLETADGGIILAGGLMRMAYQDQGIYIAKTDIDGSLQWEEYLYTNIGNGYNVDLKADADGNYVVMGSTTDVSYFWKVDDAGNMLDSFSVNHPNKFLKEFSIESNGNYVGIGQAFMPPNNDFFLLKMTSAGVLISNQDVDIDGNDSGTKIIATNDGNFLIAGFIKEVQDTNFVTANSYLAKIDENNTILWDYELEHNDGAFRNMIELSNGNLLFLYFQNNFVSSKVGLKEFNQTGDLLTEKDLYMDESFLPSGLSETADGGLLLTLKKQIGLNGTIAVVKLDVDRNEEWLFETDNFLEAQLLDVIEKTSGNYAAVGRFLNLNNNSTSNPYPADVLLLNLDNAGTVFSNKLTGKVFFDENVDCTFENTEMTLENRVVTLTDELGVQFYGLTDADGQYTFDTDTGTYELRLIPFNNYWESCQDSFVVEILQANDTTEVDLPALAVVNCPRMEVNIANDVMRPCLFENKYWITYCNSGTEAADDVSVEVLVSEFVDVFGASIPYTQTGNTLTFDLGTVDLGECGNFFIEFNLDCDSVSLGDQICAEAHIFPDSLCIEPDWDGAYIDVEGACEQDSVTFMIRNDGMDMDAPANYIIIEDNIILLESPFQLNMDEILEVKYPVSLDATYTLLAEQAPGLPNALGLPYAISVVDACIGQSGDFFNQFPQNDPEPYFDVECSTVTGSYDPNDKTPFPKGLGEEHFIEPNTAIDYLIRFQNTGTDTAFTVVIRDDISPLLDLSSLQFLGSSHLYTAEIVAGRTLKFTFNNILLPDSTTNEAASQGFVKFKINQQRDLPIGTIIENTAGIYFDYNAPIITNTTFHEIGIPFFEIIDSATEVFDEKINLAVYPNPATEMATFELKNAENETCKFQLFDALGKEVRQDRFDYGKYYFQRDGLKSGIYFFTIKNKKGKVVSGKLILH